MNKKIANEIKEMSQVVLVMSIFGFSLILIALNIILGWEKWTIPLCMAAVFASLYIHISRKTDENQRINMYAAILIIEMFYYSVNVDTLYDCTPVVVVMIVLFAITGEKVLTRICMIVGYSGMIFHIYEAHKFNYQGVEMSHIVRTIWHLTLILLVGKVFTKLINSMLKADKEYEERIRELENENKSASDFLANVSHEIRTPINAVIGLTGVCLEKEKDEEIRKDMEAVVKAGKRIAEQISDILDYSEIDIKKLAVNEENYMIASVVNDVITESRMYKKPELELIVDIDPRLPAVMSGDAAKLKKILWHLIGNGLKYTNNGGVYVRVSGIKHSYGINLIIDVKDTGIGMTNEEVERVFDRFYQADSGRTRTAGGLGLGMAIVDGFVRSLGGFLLIESSENSGTTVRVSIPQQIVDENECMSLRNRNEMILGAYLHFEKYENPHVREFYNIMVRNVVSGLKVKMHKVENVQSLKKLKAGLNMTHLFIGQEEYEDNVEYIEKLSEEMMVIVVANENLNIKEESKVRILKKPFYSFNAVAILNSGQNTGSEERLIVKGVRALVVDDEPMNLTVANGVFRRYGMIVTTALSGSEAIALCKEKEFDIIFMDHMMPVMDGIETMKCIRADKRDIVIVALTANAVSSAKEMFIKAGFDGFVSKPIELIELERVLKRVLPDSLVTVGKQEIKKDDEPIDENSRFTELSELGIDVKKGMRFCQNDAEFYKTVLSQFASDAPVKVSGMKKYYREKDFKEYTILVHGLKGIAKTIGAVHLSEIALNLENASKEKEEDTINKYHDDMIEKYEALSKGLTDLLGESIIEENDDIMEFMPEGDEKE